MPAGAAAQTGTSARGLALTSLILGIVAILFGLASFFVFGVVFSGVAVICGVVGLILGLVGRSRGRSGMSLAGIILCAVGIVIGVLLFILVEVALHSR